LSQGELYTFLTAKTGKGKKRTIIASIKGTRSSDIINVLEKIPLSIRNKVKEVTLDMAKNMQAAIKMCFPKAKIVIDRFHAVKLVIDALQHIRIKHRWIEIDKENEKIIKAKKTKEKYRPKTFSNGDTPKQLLARSRHLLAKKEKDWTLDQKERSVILFNEYPEIKKAYNHVMTFRNIYENKSKSMALIQFECWIDITNKLNIKEFATAAKSIKYHLDNIINFFDNRSTNANAESFNSKIKLFRANQRGVTDTKFFLFRLQNLFA
jgi:transposase